MLEEKFTFLDLMTRNPPVMPPRLSDIREPLLNTSGREHIPLETVERQNQVLVHTQHTCAQTLSPSLSSSSYCTFSTLTSCSHRMKKKDSFIVLINICLSWRPLLELKDLLLDRIVLNHLILPDLRQIIHIWLYRTRPMKKKATQLLSTAPETQILTTKSLLGTLHPVGKIMLTAVCILRGEVRQLPPLPIL